MANIDESCLCGHTKHQCAHNVSDTVHLLDNLVFTVYDKKLLLLLVYCLVHWSSVFVFALLCITLCPF